MNVIICIPNLEAGLEYWNRQEPSLNAVLGGFGNGPLPRVDSLGSRQFLLSLMPNLCTVPSALCRLPPRASSPTSSIPHRRTRALDVGAGIGRVTSTVLLPLVDDVVQVEPISKFIEEAIRSSPTWKGINGCTKSVTFVRQTLQGFDPRSDPVERPLTRVGYLPPEGELEESGYDVIWCQWCLGHLSDPELVEFLQKCKLSLRNGSPTGIIVIKENLCMDGENASPETYFDPEDSSLTRSNAAWLQIFVHAGLTLIREQVQLGLPFGLYEVKMYALR